MNFFEGVAVDKLLQIITILAVGAVGFIVNDLRARVVRLEDHFFGEKK